MATCQRRNTSKHQGEDSREKIVHPAGSAPAGLVKTCPGEAWVFPPKTRIVSSSVQGPPPTAKRLDFDLGEGSWTTVYAKSNCGAVQKKLMFDTAGRRHFGFKPVSGGTVFSRDGMESERED